MGISISSCSQDELKREIPTTPFAPFLHMAGTQQIPVAMHTNALLRPGNAEGRRQGPAVGGAEQGEEGPIVS